jgi:wyosine [tRNA(Phe)-imidazoG37] synthetase (radical SAM superfamily)
MSTPLFAHHPRTWRENRYVYPVVSRRSRGLSIGVNLNPDKACNFDCVYCSVDRTVAPAVTTVDLAVLRDELAGMCALAASGGIWDETPFDRTPQNLRRWNDVAFSGDGEPTAFPAFAAACQVASDILVQRDDVKTVLITNATLLDRASTEAGLAILDQRPSEIWAKLDAGTEGWYQTVERSKVPLAKVVANLAAAGRRRPLVVQSLFLTLDGRDAGDAEYDAWAARLADLLRQGARVDRVQVYTTARATAESSCGPLPVERLEAIADRARRLGVRAEVFG